MVFFPNHQLEIFEYVELQELNSYKEPKKGYVYKETIPCDFQAMNQTETIKEFGELLEDTYKIYLEKNTVIPSSAILRIEGKEDTYEITGTPINNNHLLPVQHVKIIVQKTRKPTKLIGGSP